MEITHLFISVPVASFRVGQAREFWETYPCPPPSTVYGMLLSTVGEANRLVHKGAEIALALLSEPKRSVILRTLWRVKEIKSGLGLGTNKRPDFQEILTDICISVWIRRGKVENSAIPLAQRLNVALQNCGSVKRFGGLCLGESSHLVNELREWRPGDPATGRLLIADTQGDLSLPIWPDHVGSRGTLWGQFRLEDKADFENRKLESHDPAWVSIHPPVEGCHT